MLLLLYIFCQPYRFCVVHFGLLIGVRTLYTLLHYICHKYYSSFEFELPVHVQRGQDWICTLSSVVIGC